MNESVSDVRQVHTFIPKNPEFYEKDLFLQETVGKDIRDSTCFDAALSNQIDNDEELCENRQAYRR